MTSPGILRVAVDIGGTFTDTVLMTDTQVILATSKTLTTHSNPSQGALIGVCQTIDDAGISMGDITGIIHGTTLATNALIERRGMAGYGLGEYLRATIPGEDHMEASLRALSAWREKEYG